MLLRLVLACACMLALPATTASAAVTPRSLKAPKISGSVTVGHTLKVGRGRWSGRPTRFSYRWLRCDARATHGRWISRQPHSRHKLTPADAGHRLRADVTARRGTRHRTRRSGATRVVRAAPVTAPP